MFSIFLGPQPERFLRKAEKELRQRIWKKLDGLKIDPFHSEVVRIIGEKNKAFRVRVGDYRIQYFVLQEKKEIVVFDIDKRGRAYD